MTDTQDTEAGLSPEVDQVIRQIEEIGNLLSVEAHGYQWSDADSQPLVAKAILCLIDDAQTAGKVFCSIARIAE